MEVATAVEQRRPIKETPAQRLARELSAFFIGLVRVAALSALLIPIILFSFLTVDMPVRALDHYFAEPLAKPSNWLATGDIVISAGLLLAILIARRFGGDEASRVITVSWAVAALAAFAEISVLAPELKEGDLPSALFAGSFVASAMIGQFIAVSVYDVTRGGGAWWRPPLYSALCGYAAHSFIFFLAAYWNTGAPWANWMIGDFAVKIALAFAFLPFYAILRRKLRPRGGFGG